MSREPVSLAVLGIAAAWFGVAALAACSTTSGGAADLSGAPPDLMTAPDLAKSPPDLSGEAFWVYAGVDAGQVLRFRADTGLRTMLPMGSTPAGQNPSFLAFSPQSSVFYAVEENGAAVQALRVDAASGALTALNRVTGIPDGPVHVVTDRPQRHALVASYTAGALTVLSIEADGRLGAVSDRRSTGAQAHCVGLDPSGRFVFVPNKGANTISQLRYAEAAGTLSDNAPAQVSAAAGAGPRHIDFRADGRFAYVSNELDSTVTAYALSGTGTLSAVQTLSTLPSGVSGAGNTAAEVAVAPSGRFVYVSNRGHDSIAIYRVDAASGQLALVGHQTSGGKTPRHFSLTAAGRLLLVANQGSSAIALFRVDTETGLLTPLAAASTTGAPAWVGATSVN